MHRPATTKNPFLARHRRRRRREQLIRTHAMMCGDVRESAPQRKTNLPHQLDGDVM
jgi:hypothetical protein